MAAPVIEDMVFKGRVSPLSVDQYEAMIARGILAEGAPIELLDGRLVRKDRSAAGEDPMTVGPRHASAVIALDEALAAPAKKRRCHLRIQAPIRLAHFSEPEPDVAVIKGSSRDFPDRHPGPKDVVSVIEVSDSSLELDRTAKAKLYAVAGLPQYVIVNLVADRIEVYDRPRAGRYLRTAVFMKPASTLKIGGITVRVRDLLP